MSAVQRVSAVVKVEPVGTRIACGFRHYADGRVETAWDEPVYPDADVANGRRLRDARPRGGQGAANIRYLTPRDAARAIGVTMLQWFELCRGAATFADPSDWERAIKLLSGEPEESAP